MILCDTFSSRLAFLVEDSGLVEDLGVYSAPDLPVSPDLPRSFWSWLHQEALAHHLTHTQHLRDLFGLAVPDALVHHGANAHPRAPGRRITNHRAPGRRITKPGRSGHRVCQLERRANRSSARAVSARPW